LEASAALTDCPLLAPVLPRTVAAIGRNYAAHAAELGNPVPSRPLIFLKAPSSVCGPGDMILLPPDSERVEHEAELGVVIGRRCRHVAPEHYAEVVAGYTVVLDVTARDLQRSDGQFARGKGFDTFCPIGPWMETSLDPRDVEVGCEVNGEVRQRGRTTAMIFDVPTLIATVSRVMTLRPGDVIATGTPAGVGPLRDGDVVVAWVDGIGELRCPVRADPDVPHREPPIAQAR
jgi:2-keto-4-pentenoate hydratase/2-oxohepta-3-ene-1,7-dioic acid hydratase in catechol pathway